MMINKSPKFSKASTFYPLPSAIYPRLPTFYPRPYRQKRTVVNVVIELFDNSPHDPL